MRPFLARATTLPLSGGTLAAMLLAPSLALAAGSPAPSSADAVVGADVIGVRAPDQSSFAFATAAPGSDGAVRLGGLPVELRDDVRGGTATVTIRPVGSRGGMSATLDGDAGRTGDAELAVRPRFPLIEGTPYEIVLRAVDGAETVVPIMTRGSESESAAPPPPRVVGVWPEGPVVPENALRLYLAFDRPMARGSLRDRVRLETASGERLDDSFLNLATELWSRDQTRLTLLLDPGRIKRGVGPNEVIGAPLETGRAYRLVVDAAMTDAQGRALGEDHVHAFRTGPAERRAIDPSNWHMRPPAPGTREPLSVTFDRTIDRPNAERTIVPLAADGTAIRGAATATDRGWSFVPDADWPNEVLRLRVDPRLEDVVGNTICHSFDVAAGEGGTCREARTLLVR